jgi:hypothetical protein
MELPGQRGLDSPHVAAVCAMPSMGIESQSVFGDCEMVNVASPPHFALFVPTSPMGVESQAMFANACLGFSPITHNTSTSQVAPGTSSDDWPSVDTQSGALHGQGNSGMLTQLPSLGLVAGFFKTQGLKLPKPGEADGAQCQHPGGDASSPRPLSDWTPTEVVFSSPRVFTPTLPDGACTPTEIECTSTELDGETPIGTPPALGCTLMGLMSQPWQGGEAGWPGLRFDNSTQADGMDDMCDSQLTQNDDHMAGLSSAPQFEAQGPPALQKVWWHDDPQFWKSVRTALLPLSTESWFSSIFFWDSQCYFASGFDDCLSAASLFIHREIAYQTEFKIGITESPFCRWHSLTYGYKKEGWVTMYLLYVAPTSKSILSGFEDPWVERAKLESTGAMERKLIEIFANGQPNGCKNAEGSGGECPSDGNPHFTYVSTKG